MVVGETRWRRWPGRPTGLGVHTGPTQDGSGVPSPEGERWSTCGGCSVRWNARMAGSWRSSRATPLPKGLTNDNLICRIASVDLGLALFSGLVTEWFRVDLTVAESCQ